MDLNGNPRVQGEQVDQGAYENSGVPPLPPAVVLVPNVVGQTQSTAQSMITSVALVVGTITQAYSDTVPTGRVISQNPVGGSTAIVGSAVDLTISKGPDPGSSWSLERIAEITFTIPNPPPSFPITVEGSSSWTFYASGATDWKFEISGIPAVGGIWTTNPSSGTVSSGWHTINFTIQGLNVDVSSLAPGERTIAEIRFYTR